MSAARACCTISARGGYLLLQAAMHESFHHIIDEERPPQPSAIFFDDFAIGRLFLQGPSEFLVQALCCGACHAYWLLRIGKPALLPSSATELGGQSDSVESRWRDARKAPPIQKSRSGARPGNLGGDTSGLSQESHRQIGRPTQTGC